MDTRVSVCVKEKVPPLLWGDPGVGKSSLVRALARELDLPMITLVGSIMDPTDVSGIPVPRGDAAYFLPPSWAIRARDIPHIIFVDELTTVGPSVQAALLRLVLDRAAGDVELHPETIIIAAANPPHMAPGGRNLSPAMLNRFCHLWVEPDVQSFSRFLATGAWPESNEGLDAPSVKRELSMKLVSEFVSSFPGAVHCFPGVEKLIARDEARGDEFIETVAWPSLRSWEMAARLFAGAREMGAGENVVRSLVSGCVGRESALEFLTWVRSKDVPDPERLIGNPSLARGVSGMRPDIIAAAADAIAAAVKRDLSKDRWDRAWLALVYMGAPNITAKAASLLASMAQPGWMPPRAAVEIYAPIVGIKI